MRTKPLYKLTIEEVDRICIRYLPNCEECPLHTHIRAPSYGRCLQPIIWAVCEDRELLDTPIEIDKEKQMRTKPLYKLTIEEVDRICIRYLPNCEECPLHTHIRAPSYGRCLQPTIWALCEDRELLDTPIEIDKEE